MSLRVGWNEAPSLSDCHDVTMQEISPSWTPHGAVLRAGRDLSAWIFGAVSSPCSPSFSAPKEFSPTKTQSWDLATAPRSSSSTSLPLAIHDLPWEIMQDIFQEYLRSSPHFPELLNLPGSYRRIRTHYDATTTPILLGHVCSSWRTIVMSTPSLWSTMLALSPEPCDLPLAKLWLARSGHCLLDLTIVDGHARDVDPTQSAIALLLSAAIRRSSQWRMVDLRLGPAMESLFLSISSLETPSLDHFEIDVKDWSAGGTDHLFQLLSANSRPRAIRWGWSCDLPSVASGQPWTCLHHLRIGRVETDRILSSLCTMQGLQSLVIDDLDDRSPLTGRSSTMVELPRLTKLSVDRYNTITPLLDNLNLPSLDALRLGSGINHRGDTDSGCESLANLIKRSGCQIRCLHWSDCCLREAGSIQQISLIGRIGLADIEQLIYDVPASDKFVDTMKEMTSIFPRLRSLALPDCSASVSRLEELAMSRPTLLFLGVKIHSTRLIIREHQKHAHPAEIRRKTPYCAWF